MSIGILHGIGIKQRKGIMLNLSILIKLILGNLTVDLMQWLERNIIDNSKGLISD